MKKTKEVFNWIIDLLENLNVPYQISGGMAARIYGSQRDLADIDIDVPEEFISKIFDQVKEYVTYGPERYKDDTFDIELMTFEKDGQEVDIAGFGTGKLFDKSSKQWINDKVDLPKAETHELFGRKVSVISSEKLLWYKNLIKRDVDLEDIRQIELHKKIE